MRTNSGWRFHHSVDMHYQTQVILFKRESEISVFYTWNSRANTFDDLTVSELQLREPQNPKAQRGVVRLFLTSQ